MGDVPLQCLITGGYERRCTLESPRLGRFDLSMFKYIYIYVYSWMCFESKQLVPVAQTLENL